ncbi:MAG: glycerol-3-phosphate 1-O-acyltransferase PlsY [Verrucomicrobiota bacterium]
MDPWILLGFAFLLGSLPFGFWVGKSRGIDIRQHGSGNIGSTNVSRVLGKKWGFLVFGLDFLKGWGAVFLMKKYAVLADPTMIHVWSVGAALLVIMGHNYTPWLGFKGGKGIASSAGVLLALMPWALLVGVVTWVLLMKLTKTVSIASLAACVVVPSATWFLYPGEKALFFFAFLAGAMGIWRHRSNIRRLIAGEEFSFKKESSKTGPTP